MCSVGIRGSWSPFSFVVFVARAKKLWKADLKSCAPRRGRQTFRLCAFPLMTDLKKKWGTGLLFVRQLAPQRTLCSTTRRSKTRTDSSAFGFLKVIQNVTAQVLVHKSYSESTMGILGKVINRGGGGFGGRYR